MEKHFGEPLFIGYIIHLSILKIIQINWHNLTTSQQNPIEIKLLWISIKHK